MWVHFPCSRGHRRAGDDTSFEMSSVTNHIVACNDWTLPRSAAFKRYVEGMQKPDSGMSLVADDKARSSIWSVRTVDYIAALRKQLMDDSRQWVLVSDSRNHVIQECRDLHLELQKVLGKRVCHAKSWNETSLPYMYNAMKSKCFDTSPSDLSRTCRKQGHSCLRKIISWAQHPGRAFFRRASRACEILLRHLRVGWETKSLCLPSVLNCDAAGRTLLLPQCLICTLSAPAGDVAWTWMTTRRSLRMQRDSMKRCPKTRSSRPLSGSPGYGRCLFVDHNVGLFASSSFRQMTTVSA